MECLESRHAKLYDGDICLHKLAVAENQRPFSAESVFHPFEDDLREPVTPRQKARGFESCGEQLEMILASLRKFARSAPCIRIAFRSQNNRHLDAINVGS